MHSPLCSILSIVNFQEQLWLSIPPFEIAERDEPKHSGPILSLTHGTQDQQVHLNFIVPMVSNQLRATIIEHAAAVLGVQVIIH